MLLEAAEAGRVLAVLHGLSFTLPGGLFTPLERRKERVGSEKKKKKWTAQKRKRKEPEGKERLIRKVK